MTCTFCETKSSRYNMTQRCCQIRFILNMPKERRQGYYQQVRREQGDDAAQAVIDEVKAAHQQRSANILDVHKTQDN